MFKVPTVDFFNIMQERVKASVLFFYILSKESISKIMKNLLHLKSSFRSGDFHRTFPFPFSKVQMKLEQLWRRKMAFINKQMQLLE